MPCWVPYRRLDSHECGTAASEVSDWRAVERPTYDTASGSKAERQYLQSQVAQTGGTEMGFLNKLFGSKQSTASPTSDEPLKSTEPSASVKEEPAKPAWTPIIPGNASHMPLSDLLHIFIFTDGDGQAVLDSPVATGTLQDTAEAPLKDFMGRVQFDVIARSNVASQIQQTGKFPESAWASMSKIDSAITQEARAGTYRSVVRVIPDPRTKEQFAFVLIYRM